MSVFNKTVYRNTFIAQRLHNLKEILLNKYYGRNNRNLSYRLTDKEICQNIILEETLFTWYLFNMFRQPSVRSLLLF